MSDVVLIHHLLFEGISGLQSHQRNINYISIYHTLKIKLIILYMSNSRNTSPKYKPFNSETRLRSPEEDTTVKTSNATSSKLIISHQQKLDSFLETNYPHLLQQNKLNEVPKSPKKDINEIANQIKQLPIKKFQDKKLERKDTTKSSKIQQNALYKQLIKIEENLNKRAPRMSQPVLPTEDYEEMNSDIHSQHNQARKDLVKDTRKPQKQASEPVRIITEETQAPSIIGSFKKHKELKQTVSTNDSKEVKPHFYKKQSKRLENEKSEKGEKKQKEQSQSQSGFKPSDFLRGKMIGSGKFGNVYVVKHKLTGFVCAMKCIPKSMIKQENIFNQLIRQLKIQSCLDHPNITKLYGFFDDSQHFYLLLELASSGQLYKILKQKRRFAQQTVIYLIKQVCQAIRYLHTFKIIHRDIKPENIVMQYTTVKLCDFGWAVCRGVQLRSTFCGTPLYVSPEILKGQQYDQKIDLWAIGILTYQLLCGEIPFEISSQEELVKIIKEDIVFPTDIPVSAEAKDFILRILKKNPQDRMKIAQLLEHPFLEKKEASLQLDV